MRNNMRHQFSAGGVAQNHAFHIGAVRAVALAGRGLAGRIMGSYAMPEEAGHPVSTLQFIA